MSIDNIINNNNNPKEKNNSRIPKKNEKNKKNATKYYVLQEYLYFFMFKMKNFEKNSAAFLIIQAFLTFCVFRNSSILLLALAASTHKLTSKYYTRRLSRQTCIITHRTESATRRAMRIHAPTHLSLLYHWKDSRKTDETFPKRGKIIDNSRSEKGKTADKVVAMSERVLWSFKERCLDC